MTKSINEKNHIRQIYNFSLNTDIILMEWWICQLMGRCVRVGNASDLTNISVCFI